MSEVTIQADGETLEALIFIRGMLDSEIEQSLEEGLGGMKSLRLTTLKKAQSKVEEWVEDVILVVEKQGKLGHELP